MAEHDEGQDGVGAEDEDAREAAPHLPTATIFPFGFAGGIALLLIGLVINWWIVAVGAVIAIVFGFLWVRDATAEYRKRPAPPVPTRDEAALAAVEEEEQPERYSRNKFLELSTLGLGGLVGAVVTIPVVGFAVAPTFIDDPTEDNIDVGPLEEFEEGKYVVATFEAFPGQGAVGRQTAFIRNNGIANGVPSFTIVSNHCVHLGCPVQPNGPTDFENPKTIDTETGPVDLVATQPAGFGCPCHGGQYDNEGNRTAGPPVRALDRYQYSIVNGRLVLGERFSVAHVTGTGAEAQIEAWGRRYPGSQIDNWEKVLYPWSGF